MGGHRKTERPDLSNPHSPSPDSEDSDSQAKGTKTGRKWLGNLVKFAIPAGIIGFLLWNIDQEQWDALSQSNKDYGVLAIALVIAILAMALSFARWCILVRALGIDLTMLEAQRLGSICFLLSFVSAGSVGGDVFKAIFLARRRAGKRIEAVASVLVDRGAGLYGLLVLVTIALLFLDAPADAQYMGKVTQGTAALVGLGTVVLAILVFGGGIVDRLITWGSTLPVLGGLVEKIGPPLRMFHNHKIAFGMSILMSIGVQSLLVISIYFVARGLYPQVAGGIQVPTLAEHFVIVPIGMLMSALPLAPAGLGLLEAAIGKLYEVVPAVKTKASGVLVALVFEIVKLVMGFIGTIFYWTANEEVRESLEEAEESE